MIVYLHIYIKTITATGCQSLCQMLDALPVAETMVTTIGG
jgi:hypothetical protein